MKKSQLLKNLSKGVCDSAFKKLYGSDCDLISIRQRYQNAVEEFLKIYGNKLSEQDNIFLFSVPGRSEIAGNHTDHNLGCVLAASISLDIIAVAAKIDNKQIYIKSQGFEEDVVSLPNCQTVRENEKFKASAIVRGMCDGFLKSKLNIGGFAAYTTSDVLKGSGLSSSAAFEVMVGNILNHLYNNGRCDAVEIAKIAQYAENRHFGKPCGLMDQIACAVGGFVSVDFEVPSCPKVTGIPFNIKDFGYSLCIINTGGNHADLNHDYESIPFEMMRVASVFGEKTLNKISKNKLLANARKVRSECGDRAFLRALHFCNENLIVNKQTENIKNKNMKGFIEGIKASGLSSAIKLQNIFTTKNVEQQGITVALALAGEVLDKYGDCAYRVHGGGFAGTIQVFCKTDVVGELVSVMNSVFGEGSCYILDIRAFGAVKISDLL